MSTLNISGSILNVSGNLTVSSSGVFLAGSGVLNLSGGSHYVTFSGQSLPVTNIYDNLTLTGSGIINRLIFGYPNLTGIFST